MTSHKHPHVCHQSEMLVEILFTDPDLHSADLIFVGTGGTGGPVKFFLTVQLGKQCEFAWKLPSNL